MEDGQGWAIGPVAMTTASVAPTSASATPWLRTREHRESSTADGDGTAAAAAPVHFQWEVVVAVMPTRYEVDDAVSVYYGADTALAAAAIVTAGGTESSAMMTIVPGERDILLLFHSITEYSTYICCNIMFNVFGNFSRWSAVHAPRATD